MSFDFKKSLHFLMDRHILDTVCFTNTMSSLKYFSPFMPTRTFRSSLLYLIDWIDQLLVYPECLSNEHQIIFIYFLGLSQNHVAGFLTENGKRK